MLTITQLLLQQNAHFLLLKASDITICTLCHHILPLHVSTRVGHLQGAQCQCLTKVIINYNLLKLC
jgi:GTP cyclohydrolase I